MHGNFPYIIDIWVNPVAHLLLLRSSMALHIVAATSVTRLGDLLDFGQIFKAYCNN